MYALSFRIYSACTVSDAPLSLPSAHFPRVTTPLQSSEFIRAYEQHTCSIIYLSVRIFHRRSLPDLRAAMLPTLFPSVPVHLIRRLPEELSQPPHALPKKVAVWCQVASHMLRGMLAARFTMSTHAQSRSSVAASRSPAGGKLRVIASSGEGVGAGPCATDEQLVGVGQGVCRLPSRREGMR